VSLAFANNKAGQFYMQDGRGNVYRPCPKEPCFWWHCIRKIFTEG